MVEIQDYEKIDAFKNTIHRHMIDYPQEGSFRILCSELLEEVFGYKCSAFGYNNGSLKKKVELNFTSHNITFKDIQVLFTEEFRDKLSRIPQDIFLVSETPLYTAHLQSTLRACGYADILVMFLNINGRYEGFLMILHTRKEGKFRKRDLEIAGKLTDYIAVEYYNYKKYFALQNLNDLLISQTNYFPVGLIMVENGDDFFYFNENAREMIKELGIGSTKLFEVFYNNEIYPKIRFSKQEFGKGQYVRYKNYRFSVVLINPYNNFARATNTTSSSFSAYRDAYDGNLTFIYCMKEEDAIPDLVRRAGELHQLSKREKEITELLLEGRDRAQISQLLKISINTVNSHLQSIYRKTNSNGVVELISKLQRQ